MMKGVAKLRKTDYVISNDPPLLPSTNSGFGACQLYTLSRPKPRATYCGKKSGATAQLFTCMEPSFSSACRTGRPRHPTMYSTRDALHLPSNEHKSVAKLMSAKISTKYRSCHAWAWGTLWWMIELPRDNLSVMAGKPQWFHSP